MDSHTVKVDDGLVQNIDLYMVFIPDVDARDDLLAFSESGNNALETMDKPNEIIEELAIPGAHRTRIFFHGFSFDSLKQAIASLFCHKLLDNIVVVLCERSHGFKFVFSEHLKYFCVALEYFHPGDVQEVDARLGKEPDAHLNDRKMGVVSFWRRESTQVKEIR